MMPLAFLLLIGLCLVAFSGAKEADNKPKLTCNCFANENNYRVIGGQNLTKEGVFPCLINRYRLLRVGYGAVDLVKMFKLGLYKEIAGVVWHSEAEKEKDKYHDIGVIRLDSPFIWSNTVKPACLPSGDYNRAFPRHLMVTGFGLLNVPSFSSDDQPLSYAIMSRYLKLAFGQDTTFNENFVPRCKENAALAICVYNQTKTGQTDNPTLWQSACLGDEGGPLHAVNDRGRSVVVGLVSRFKKLAFSEEGGWYTKCARTQVYTRVTAYLDWIKEIVGKRADQDYCEADLTFNQKERTSTNRRRNRYPPNETKNVGKTERNQKSKI